MREVKLYTSKNCVYCDMTKVLLDEYFIDYQEINIDANQNNRDKAKEISNQDGVPVLSINGEIIIGFDEKEIKSALSLE